MTAMERWKPLSLAATSKPWPERMDAVLLELHVESNPRYRASAAQTWCNVFATDVVQGMGLGAPRHWMTTKGEPAAVGRGYELTANLLWDWLHAHGGTYGWMHAEREVAEKAAQRGHVTLVVWRNAKGPGHVAVLLGPDKITQAGKRCFRQGRIAEGFGAAEPLEFWVQMERGGPPHKEKP